MAALIKISDLTFNGRIQLIAFDLIDLLALILLEGSTLIWSVRGNLDVLGGKTPVPQPIHEQLNSKMYLDPKGMLLSWKELLAYANSTVQISDGVFVGCKNVDLLPLNVSPYKHPFINPGNDLYRASEIVFEAYESSFWTVYARDNAVIERFSSAFQSVEIIKTW